MINFFLLKADDDDETFGKHLTEDLDIKNWLDLDDKFWKQKLTPTQYKVCRKQATEKAGSGKLLSESRDGMFACSNCGLELFEQNTKFDSGTGWPSFFSPIDSKNILETEDRTLGITRTEVKCNRCHSHLGHVFTDGPKPSGLRYCINSVSLIFKPNK